MHISACECIYTVIRIFFTVHCLAPKDFENGVTNCSKDQNYFYEDICYFMCDTGYELIGSNIKMCLSNRNWSVSETKCQKG